MSQSAYLCRACGTLWDTSAGSLAPNRELGLCPPCYLDVQGALKWKTDLIRYLLEP